MLGNTLSLSNGRCDWPVYADKVTGSGSLGGGGDLSRGELSGTSITIDGQSLSLEIACNRCLTLKSGRAGHPRGLRVRQGEGRDRDRADVARLAF